MSDLTMTLVILVVAVAVFIWNKLPVGIVALGVALALWATGILSVDEVLAGFGSPTVVLIAALFVVAEALDAAGITTWAGQLLIQHSAGSEAKLMVFTMGAGALMSALITPNGAVAALFPMVVVMAVRLGMSPSRLLMPLAFAAHAGSLLVLTGSPVNVLIAEAAMDAGAEPIGFFEFALVGLPLLAGTIVVVVLFGSRLLPERDARTMSRDLSRLPATLVRQYLDPGELARLRVEPGSPLIGQEAAQLDLRQYENLHVIARQDSLGQPQRDDVPIDPATVLVVRGPSDQVEAFASGQGLRVEPAQQDTYGLVSRDFGVTEVLVTPRSAYLGDRVFPGMVTESGSLVILAVARHGEDVGTGETVLKTGDSLLLQGTWAALDEHTRDPNVLVVDSPESIRRQTLPLGPKAVPALIVLGLMVLALTTGLVPSVVVVLLAAMAMVLLRVVSVDHAHRAISWSTLILVAGMIPLSTAITETGAADLLAGTIVDAVGGGGPFLLLLGLFLVTAVLGQLISNTATALILIPIAISVAAEMGASPLALLMCVNVASAAALLTPVATPGNMMVMGPGGYEFSDYARLGLPVLVVYLLVSVLLVPVWWPI